MLHAITTAENEMEGHILITGGSGFLGRAILRRADRENWSARVTVYSRDETKQWELKRRYPDVHCVLGDVRDRERLEALMSGVDLVIHAAAVKYIPEAEHNVEETVGVNVEGSKAVARAAARAGVPRVVGISTDKACAPLNTYGATKMLMERLFAEANRWSDTRFVTVRYGNVVGSTGSVIPIFAQQLADSGRLRITDARMTRFWLSPDGAIDLIIHALDNAARHPGATFIGKNPAMSITSLARAVWVVAAGGLPPTNTPIAKTVNELIDVTGIRPGEKLAEELFNAQEAPRVELTPLGDGFILQPATRAPLASDDASSLGWENGYSSGAPAWWVGVAEMVDMIEDARTI